MKLKWETTRTITKGLHNLPQTFERQYYLNKAIPQTHDLRIAPTFHDTIPKASQLEWHLPPQRPLVKNKAEQREPFMQTTKKHDEGRINESTA